MHVDRLIRAAVASATVAVLTAAMPTAAHAQGDVSRFWGYYQLTDGDWVFAATGPTRIEQQVELALPGQSGDERVTKTAQAEEPAEEDDNSGLAVGLLVGLGIVAVVGASAAVRRRGSKAE
jgi:hypothetical protein